MPYVHNKGIQIHYKVEGEGPPLVLQHWSFGSLDDWYDYGYVAGLKDAYQLILLDARGHGASDKPYDPEAYRLEQRVGDIVAILDDLGVEKAHYFGYSMGGWIGFGIARYAASRFCSLIIGGQHPYAQNLYGLRTLARYGLENGPEAYIEEMWEKENGPLSRQQKERMLKYDFKAFLVLAQDRESLEDALPVMRMPCMLIVAEKDDVFPAAQKCFPLIPKGKFVTVPGVDHLTAFMRSDLILPDIKGFLKEQATS